MNICLFLQSGRTYSFKNVVITCNNESFLGFTYRAMSDGVAKQMTVQKRAIVGWSTHEERDSNE